MQIVNPNGPNPFPPPPIKPGAPPTKPLGSSPGLLTSTGGLYGVNGALLTPVFNSITGKSNILIMDANNFDCEEDGEYDFPQEIPPREQPQEGRDVTCHLVILKYRELGYARFAVNLTTYKRLTDSFVTVQYLVNIPPIPLKTRMRKQSFPDKEIHTLYIPIQVVGERPQASITRSGKSGPMSITSLTICGNADQTPQM